MDKDGIPPSPTAGKNLMAHLANLTCPRQANEFDTWWSATSGKTYQLHLGHWADPLEVDEHITNRWRTSQQLFNSLNGISDREPLPYRGLHKKILLWQAKNEKQKQVR